MAVCSEYKLGLCSAVTETLSLWLVQLRSNFCQKTLNTRVLGPHSNSMAPSVSFYCAVHSHCGVDGHGLGFRRARRGHMSTPGLIPMAGDTVYYYWTMGFLYGQRMGLPDKGGSQEWGRGVRGCVFPTTSPNHMLFLERDFSPPPKRSMD